jgi:hypothetical protein
MSITGAFGKIEQFNHIYSLLVITHLECPAKNFINAKPCNENYVLTLHAFHEQQRKIEAQHITRTKSAKTINELLGLIQE